MDPPQLKDESMLPSIINGHAIRTCFGGLSDRAGLANQFSTLQAFVLHAKRKEAAEMKRVSLLALMLACIALEIDAKTDGDLKAIQECKFRAEQVLAASVARDFVAMERTAYEYIAECKKLGSSQVTTGYSAIAFANNQLRKPKAALVAAQHCIKAQYGEPSCHLEKAEALVTLKRFRDAQIELDIAERLYRRAYEEAEKSRETARLKIEEEIHALTIDSARMSLERIESIRARLIE